MKRHQSDHGLHSRKIPNAHVLVIALIITLVVSVGGCSTLLPKVVAAPAIHMLDELPAEQRAPRRSTAMLVTARPTLLVNPTRAAPGFDSRHVVYTRAAHKLEYYAYSEWVDTPARMLSPLIVNSLAQSDGFSAVVPIAVMAAGDLRLDTEVIRLLQQFEGDQSRVRFTLQVTLVDVSSRRVVASRKFDEVVESMGGNAQGGVVAANQAVQNVLQQVVSFCGEAAASWRISSTTSGSGRDGLATERSGRIYLPEQYRE